MTADAPLQQRYGLTVTPLNVLGIRAVVLQEAQDLDDRLKAERERIMLPPLGADPVSTDMSQAFNTATESLLNRANEHVSSLFKLGEELRSTALAYGLADADIETSFVSGSARSAASQVSPTLLAVAGMGATARRPHTDSLAGLLSPRTP